jgi:hypothetical protein
MCFKTQENFISHFDTFRVATLFLMSSMRYLCFLGFCRESSVILLSVNTTAVRWLFSGIFMVTTASRAFIMAICYAWLFEYLLSNVDLIWVAILFPVYVTVPEPTPSSLLLTSVWYGMIYDMMWYDIWSMHKLGILHSWGSAQ